MDSTAAQVSTDVLVDLINGINPQTGRSVQPPSTRAAAERLVCYVKDDVVPELRKYAEDLRDKIEETLETIDEVETAADELSDASTDEREDSFQQLDELMNGLVILLGELGLSIDKN